MAHSPEEREHLRLFRQAARQIREASVIALGQGVEIRPRLDETGAEQAEVFPLANEAFRSLALALRLVYQKKEPAHFFYVYNLVYREGPEAIRVAIVDIRARYVAAHRHAFGWVTVPTVDGSRTFTPEEVLDTWLYGVAFHQDVDRQEDVRQLEASGGHFVLAVQSTSLLLSGRILDLDDQVADLLGEARLPRIPPQPPRGL